MVGRSPSGDWLRRTSFRPTTARLTFTTMQRLQDFYRKYRQYIGTDVLMYVVFILVLVLLFVFFG